MEELNLDRLSERGKADKIYGELHSLVTSDIPRRLIEDRKESSFSLLRKLLDEYVLPPERIFKYERHVGRVILPLVALGMFLYHYKQDLVYYTI
jgi:hypothetical protein